MELLLEPGDITTKRTDAIVNAANSSLLGGGGVDGAIHRAGGPKILRACREIRRTELPDGLPPGQAVVTPAGWLYARWVIHTVGPIYSLSEDRSDVLASAYRESLRAAARVGARSVAFPAISAGVYGWPIDDAARIAVHTVRDTGREVGDVVETVVFVPFTPMAAKAFARWLAAPHGQRVEWLTE